MKYHNWMVFKFKMSLQKRKKKKLKHFNLCQKFR